jgi:hypothetical protein
MVRDAVFEKVQLCAAPGPIFSEALSSGASRRCQCKLSFYALV